MKIRKMSQVTKLGSEMTGHQKLVTSVQWCVAGPVTGGIVVIEGGTAAGHPNSAVCRQTFLSTNPKVWVSPSTGWFF